jgi:fucose 4-O-acetylase-like acetyltransferase
MPINRNAVVDNARFILIFLVVLGHFLEFFLGNNEFFRSLYIGIYTLHMPAFAFLAGIYAPRKHTYSSLQKMLRSIFIPLFLFSVIYELLHYIYWDWSSYSQKFQPYWLLWFFWSLFSWRLLLPLVLQLRQPFLWALAAALLAGLTGSISYGASLSRTMVYFPVFLAGALWGKSILAERVRIEEEGSAKEKYSEQWKLYSWIARFFTLSLFLGGASLIIWFLQGEYHQWVFQAYSYETLKWSKWGGLALRSLFLLTAFAGSMALLLLVPQKRFWWTKWGERSLYIYLWHGLWIKFLAWTTWLAYFKDWSNAALMAMLFVFSTAIVLLSGNHWLVHYTEKFLLKPFSQLILSQNDKGKKNPGIG